MKLSKEQQKFIKDATTHSEVCTEWRGKIKDAFPKLFEENELEIGKWYKWSDGSILFIEEFIGSNIFRGYGFNYNNKWTVHNFSFESNETSTPATDKEVEDALKIEAKKRGFKKGVVVDQVPAYGTGSTLEIGNSNIEFSNYSYINISVGGVGIYHKGKWATFIETITKAEAEKLLNKTIKG